MAEWVIFQTPAALLLFGAALFCSLFERFTKATKGILTYVSAALALLAAGLVLLRGGSLWEGAALLLPFVLLHAEVKV